jgi:hypothetical protein
MTHQDAPDHQFHQTIHIQCHPLKKESAVNRLLRTVLCAVPVVTLCVAGLDAAPAASQPLLPQAEQLSSPSLSQLSARPRPHLMRMRRQSPRPVLPLAGSDLIDHGGAILPTSHVYTIWWGRKGAWAPDVQPGIDKLFDGLPRSAFLARAQQYMRGDDVTTERKDTRSDPRPPSSRVTEAVLAREITRVMGPSVDPLGIYFVFTSNFPKTANFCAWHSTVAIHAVRVAVVYMPNTSNRLGCAQRAPAPTSISLGLRSLANVASHEFMEVITDAQPTSTSVAWIDNSGLEIGDKCAWIFSEPVHLSNGSVWSLQTEWSNAGSTCL